MKKGLSVLLILAALFGFYGGATNLNDVLDCKEYWEEKGKQTTADLNKLEDGINQLKDNEQAYLDGLDTLAEGEKTLAQGEADYAAAPRKLAAGEQALAEGEESLASLDKLIKGLRTAKKHGTASTKKHDTYWHDAFSKSLKPGREKIEGIATSPDYASLLGLIDMLNGQSPGTISGRFKNTSQSYASFDNKVLSTKKNFENAATVLDSYKSALFGLGDPAFDVVAAATAYQKIAAAAAAGQATEDQVEAAKDKYDAAANKFKEVAGKFNKGYAELNAAVPGLVSDPKTKASLQLLFGAITKASSDGADTIDVPGKGQQLCAGVIYSALVKDPTTGSTDSADMLKETFDGYIGNINTYAGLFGEWDTGYKKLAAAKDGKNKDDLASKSSGIPYAFQNMVSNSTIKAAIKKYDPSLMKELKKYKGNRLKNDGMVAFDKDIVHIGKDVIPRALSVLAKIKAEANKKLADGRKQLAQGRADYEAAPAKLADGRKQLADGKAKLAEYEDGEQQVRDGLATVMGSEANGGLDSILDRRNGDEDFDNGDNHLELNEGLEAVDTARGYQADSGELITAEIMSRAIGTGLSLAAAALACLAALLGLLKKYKGAGVAALLAAAAGCVGIYQGVSAGSEFSSIAGSTIGNMPWIAAGVLAGVAALHAITHFAAKKDA